MSKTQIKTELAKFKRAAKWRSRVGPQCDALTLWEAVEHLERKLKSVASNLRT